MKNFNVDALWQLERIGAPSLSPDGAQAVASVTTHSMETNKSTASLHLFSTLGGEARRLTAAGEKDGQPQWSPRGDLIAFIARREQEGAKDAEAQLYLIAPDGGEARRAATVATGVEAFKWFPDGKRIAFISWVWPQLKGAAAQAKAHKEFKDRKESGYVSEASMYRFWDHYIPMGRVPHLHVLDVATGKVRDLFEDSIYELTRAEPDAHCFDISPDGRRIVFAFDPAAEKQMGNVYTLCEIEVRTSAVRTLLADKGWDFSAPRYSHAGAHLAFLASNQGVKHTMPAQLAVLDTRGRWAVMSAEWDREPTAPLVWEEDDGTVLFGAEDRGRRHVWRFELATQQVAIAFEGGNAGSFAATAGTLLVNHDSVRFPPRLSVATESGPERIEGINDELLARHRFSKHEEVVYPGARGDDVQMWLIYPPDFNPRKKYPVLHLIHGGPHTAFGDSWHWRWNHQACAAEGYVVACVNYHGSSSFGYQFLDSITHRWGELELQDIEAGTDWLLGKPWVAPGRIFATGGSYGGYMVAWMNGHVEPGRYQAYVCHAGCFDWQAMFADDCFSYHSKELGAWYWEDPARIAAQSPHNFVAAMRTPTLVIHGALDYRVPDTQGLAYYNTLKAKGVDARLLWFPDENHWVLKPRNSQLWYGEFFSWLRRHDTARR